jgi:tetratricopeptide (TPR) repeat protein
MDASSEPIRGIVGRTEQIDRISEYITSMIAGKAAGNVLFITGEAGIGKTTLLGAIQENCGRIAQLLTASVACSTPLAGQDIGEVEALAPWAEIMRQLTLPTQEKKLGTRKLIADLAMAWVHCIPVVGDVLESVADTAVIVKDYRHGESGDTPAYAASQGQVFQQYINFLSSLSERTPLVLMIDDFHWADTSSTNLLFAAARQLQGKRALFVIAYRADDAASSRSGEGHPLLHVRNELERYGLCTEIGVPKMTPGDLDALLRSRYTNYQNNDAFEEWLARISGGNALFITQFLNTLEEDGYIDRDEGRFNDRYDDVRVPSSAYAVVQERIRRLNEETRELLRYASVEGDMFTAAVLARITELPQLKLLQRLRLLEETHRVVRALGVQRIYSSETTAYQFTHVLLHRVLSDSLGEQERQLIHEVVFNALKEEWEAAKRTHTNLPGIAARLAVHAEVLGQDLFAASVLLEGARASWKEFAEEETLRQLEGALLSLDHATGTDSKIAAKLHGEILLLRGDVHRVRARFEEGLEDVRAARSLFESAGERGMIATAESDEVSLLADLARYDEAEIIARRLVAEAERDRLPGSQAAVWGSIGVICLRTGRYHEALASFRQSLDLWKLTGDRLGQAKALNNIGLTKINLGEYSDVLDELEQSAALFSATGSRINEAHTLNTIGLVHYSLGDLATALDYFERSSTINRSIGDRTTQTAIDMNIGLLHLKLGRMDAALEQLDRALKLATEISSPHFIASALLNIGGVYSRQGDYLRGMEYTQRSLATANATGNLGTRANATINIGMIHGRLGEHDRSREVLLEALEMTRQLGWRDEEADVQNLLGLAAEQKALASEGEERAGHYRTALEHLEECIRIAHESGSPELERWEKDLERVRKVVERSDDTE